MRNKKTDDRNKGQSVELPISARGMNDGRGGMNKKGTGEFESGGGVDTAGVGS
jgi:hypothetical protein